MRKRRQPQPPAPDGASPRGDFPDSRAGAPFPNKYKAKSLTTEDGFFPSQREYKHWCLLKLREKAKEISGLERQKKFEITHNGVKITSYIADFIYFENGQRIVADSKGFRTDVYRLKKKLMKAFYNIEIVEM